MLMVEAGAYGKDTEGIFRLHQLVDVYHPVVGNPGQHGDASGFIPAPDLDHSTCFRPLWFSTNKNLKRGNDLPYGSQAFWMIVISGNHNSGNFRAHQLCKRAEDQALSIRRGCIGIEYVAGDNDQVDTFMAAYINDLVEDAFEFIRP